MMRNDKFYMPDTIITDRLSFLGGYNMERLRDCEDSELITELRDDYGRSTGYTYANNGAVQQTVCTGYGEDGRIVSAGFVYGGAQKLFTYNYLSGFHLLQSLVKPNNMTLTLSYEDKRNLLTGMWGDIYDAETSSSQSLIFQRISMQSP